jgi:hypothetical protein
MVKNGQFSHRKGIAYTPPGDTVDSSVASGRVDMDTCVPPAARGLRANKNDEQEYVQISLHIKLVVAPVLYDISLLYFVL